MNELQFPGLYIDDTANPHAILSFLCQSGYYCLILTDFLAEFGTKCGRVYCDYCDGTLISYRPDTVCVEIPAPCLWMVAFHPDLFKGKMLEKTIEEYTFFSYALKEALHVSLKEKRILSSCADTAIRKTCQTIYWRWKTCTETAYFCLLCRTTSFVGSLFQ